MQKILIGLVVVIVALLLYNFVFKKPSFKNGAVAPPIQTKLINGHDFNLSDLKGSYVLLDFWGSWCGPCLREIPEVKRLYQDFHGKKYANADDFHIVSVALEKNDKNTRKMIEARGLSWPHHIIDVSPVVIMSGIAQSYDVKELPTKFLINPEGEFMGTDLTFEEMRRILTERLEK